ncbi:MAG TPA: BamA/TamA family outer membrane protein [Caldimonas sp.]|jgi:translocation and assembly module TamA|nr:BamA/TamA family outer membrane protein [Caldimonas sp.]HEV7574572.1 BamA/TamA family outer membrane protein [Caldimonas sp.]
MKRCAAPARVLSMLLLSAGLAGCANLPFFGDRADDAAGRTAPAEPQVPLYELEVRAPGALRTLLLDYLDLARFQSAPASEAITPTELDRLAAAAPAQARSLLETEGYFDADVKVARSAGANGLPRIEIDVVPGPRVIVRSVAIDSTAPLAPRIPTRDEPWRDRLAKLRAIWSLRAGEPFRQPAWSSAKNAALGALRGDGYPRAEWQATKARIDAVEQSAALSVSVEPGPLYHVGPIRIEGTHRYDEAAIRRLASFPPGTEYSEKQLLDFQERILKLGLFEGASVELDATGPPEAAPVLVKVKEQSQHQATVGVGYSANTGPRISLEHWDRKVFGQSWIAHSTLTFGPDLKSLGTEFTSYPDERLWRKLAAAKVEQLRSADETRNSWTVRAGRSKDTTDFERLYYLEAAHARVESAPLIESADALSFNYHWLRRDLDNVLVPTSGTALALEGGVGYGRGTLTRADIPGTASSRAPFVRAYSRLNWYRPVGTWFANARVEAGEVLVTNPIAVPDPILFRAGGDNSVRGYGYRTLGPTINGAVVGGRVLLTGSAEMEHALIERLPALLGAVFVDVGDAADRWNQLRPALGVGVGLHYRSPVGPLRLDVAYGARVRQLRLHLSVGVAF